MSITYIFANQVLKNLDDSVLTFWFFFISEYDTQSIKLSNDYYKNTQT